MSEAAQRHRVLRVLPRGVSPHPEDTNDYLDIPDNVIFDVPITYKDRIDAECMNPLHCTVANALAANSKTLGIKFLARRGVSRRFVGMILDPKVHPWAKKDKVYRGKLTSRAADLTMELDLLDKSPRMQAAMRRSLKREAAKLPEGVRTVWETIQVVSPAPSERKGYRSKAKVRGRPGTGTKTPVPRRQWAPVPRAV